MQAELYYKILDELCEWYIGSEKTFETRGGGGVKGEPSSPENGYPVLLALKPRAKECGGNRSLCEYDKTYRRTSEGWDQYCKECKTHENVRPIILKQINKL